MLGAIAGDMIGAAHEFNPIKTKEFDLWPPDADFTDDSVLCCAVADCLLRRGDPNKVFRDYTRRYPDRGYGGSYTLWSMDPDAGPYNSYGNGAAMRVVPVGWACDSLEATLAEAARLTVVTHNHPEGLKGGQAVAAAVFLARAGATQAEIKLYIQDHFKYDLGYSLDEMRPYYSFNVTCQGSVPQAILCFLEADGYLDAVRNAVSLGGDCDTQACMAGGIAEAYWGLPPEVAEQAEQRLTPDLLAVVQEFTERFVVGRGRKQGGK